VAPPPASAASPPPTQARSYRTEARGKVLCARNERTRAESVIDRVVERVGAFFLFQTEEEHDDSSMTDRDRGRHGRTDHMHMGVSLSEAPQQKENTPTKGSPESAAVRRRGTASATHRGSRPA
jgi:hypothetical protein